MQPKRKICIVTGSRADYGLLWWTMSLLRKDPKIELQICVTGMHLSAEFGMTVGEIEADRFKITRKIESQLSSDSPVGISKSIALGVSGFADVFAELKPDIVLVVGDRFEIFAAVLAALSSRLPVAHCHGGETTVGAVDEALRHAITKMSHLHFVATEEYRSRVIQLGEHPKSVFLSGALSIDNIKRIKLLNKKQLEQSLGLKFLSKTLLVTFHPVTLEEDTAENQFNELLVVLESLKDTSVVFTQPNADAGGRSLIKMIEKFVTKNSNFSHSFVSLGNLRYLSLLKHANIVIGNSSSGLIEAPSFKTATINIGDRQKNRISSSSVIDVSPQRKLIRRAIDKCYSAAFFKTLSESSNPYDHGSASKVIVRTLKKVKLENLIKKNFYDLDLT